jgi:hypothetical protein
MDSNGTQSTANSLTWYRHPPQEVPPHYILSLWHCLGCGRAIYSLSCNARVKVKRHSFWTSAINESEWTASRTDRFTSKAKRLKPINGRLCWRNRRCGRFGQMTDLVTPPSNRTHIVPSQHRVITKSFCYWSYCSTLSVIFIAFTLWQ